jgi:hypothetical protein
MPNFEDINHKLLTIDYLLIKKLKNHKLLPINYHPLTKDYHLFIIYPLYLVNG